MHTLSAEQLEEAFPFFVTVDVDLRIVDAGAELRARDPGLIGRYLTEAFDIQSGKAWPKFASLGARPLVMVNLHSKIPLRGAFIVGEDRATFLGSVWVSDFQSLIRLGLDVETLPATDPTIDYLAIISKQNQALLQSHEIEKEMRTYRKRLRLAKEETEEALKAKSAFLSVMSHELRTPLNAIIGATELLLEADREETDRDLLEATRVSADGLLSCVNDILDLVDLDQGGVILDSTPVDLAALVGGVVDEFKTACAARPIELRLLSSSDIPQLVVADPQRLRRIVLELVGNAVKFTDEGIVEVRLRHVDGPMPIEIEVVDDGIGITADRMDKLFEPFACPDDVFTRSHGGLGLGLALVRRLARLMGGDVEAHARRNGGTRFVVRLALEPATVTNDVMEVLTGRVLVVDDNIVNRKIAGRFLERLGLTVTLASDGHEAVRLAEQDTYDLILMDLQMPDLDGTDATRSIRTIAQHTTTPIVALTANTRDQDRQRCRDAGMNDFLVKPLRAADLERVVQAFVPR